MCVISLLAALCLQTIGGISDSLFTGPMVYAPLNREWYYEIVITEIFVGDTAAGLDCKEVGVDPQSYQHSQMFYLLMSEYFLS